VILRRTSLLLLAIALFGCASIDSQPPADPGLSRQVAAIISDLFPHKCTMVHKVSVRVGGRDLVLTGYLLLDRAHGFRAVAVDEFGGKAFAFCHCGGQNSVDFAPPGVNEELLARGPVRDIELLFLLDAREMHVFHDADGVVTASWQSADSRVECVVDQENRRISSCREWIGGRRVRELAFGYDPEAAPGSSPKKLSVANRGLHYTMDAQLLSMQRGGNEDRQWCPETIAGETPK